MLTGKAKSDFEKWLLTDGNEVIKNGTIEYDLYYMCKYMIPQNMVCAKIIEWLDSVGYITHTHFDIETKLWGYEVFNNKLYNKLRESALYDENIDVCIVEMAVYQCRQQATEQAIIKANEIYNSQ